MRIKVTKLYPCHPRPMIPGVIYDVRDKVGEVIIKAGAAISLETNGVDDGKRTDETAEAVSTDDQQ